MNLIVKGYGGQLRFDGERITITRKGLIGFILHGMAGEKAILVSSLTAVQYKKPGFFVSGYLRFDFPGSQDSKAGIWDATKDQNAVIFQKETPELLALKAAVEERMTKATAGTPSVAAELERLAVLRDRGVLTDAEFAAQKARVLGS